MRSLATHFGDALPHAMRRLCKTLAVGWPGDDANTDADADDDDDDDDDDDSEPVAMTTTSAAIVARKPVHELVQSFVVAKAQRERKRRRELDDLQSNARLKPAAARRAARERDD